jgi:hypothetical protein
MEKSFLSGKDKGFFIFLAALVFSLASLAAYAIGGHDSYVFDTRIVVMLVLAVAVGGVLAYRDFTKMNAVVLCVPLCMAAGFFLKTRFTYFANLYYNISPEGPNFAITITVVFLAAALVASIVSAFFKQEKEE